MGGIGQRGRALEDDWAVVKSEKEDDASKDWGELLSSMCILESEQRLVDRIGRLAVEPLCLFWQCTICKCFDMNR